MLCVSFVLRALVVAVALVVALVLVLVLHSNGSKRQWCCPTLRYPALLYHALSYPAQRTGKGKERWRVGGVEGRWGGDVWDGQRRGGKGR